MIDFSEVTRITRTVDVGPVIVKFCIASVVILVVGFLIYAVSFLAGIVLAIPILIAKGSYTLYSHNEFLDNTVYPPILGAVGIIFGTIHIIIPIIVTVIIAKYCLKHCLKYCFGIKLACFGDVADPVDIPEYVDEA